MGLDIYFYHTPKKFEGDPNSLEDFSEFENDADELARRDAKMRIDYLLQSLDEAYQEKQTNFYWNEIYGYRYFKFINELDKIFGKNYEFHMYPYTKEVLQYPELCKMLEKDLAEYYLPYSAYFRKVNFLFNYFSEVMVDEQFAFVEKRDVEDIIDKCKQVLEDHDLAEDLLPTTSGFFFGSTDYDEWYFRSVEDCLNKMTEYLKSFDEEGTGYVVFSW